MTNTDISVSSGTKKILLLRLNIFIFSFFWLILLPGLHMFQLESSAMSDITTNLSSIHSAIIFIYLTLICATCLWYLNQNLILHKIPIIKYFLITLGSILILSFLHIKNYSFPTYLIVQQIIFTVLLFSLHQIRCSELKRHIFILIITIGLTLTCVTKDLGSIVLIRTFDGYTDDLLPFIGLILSLYLFLRAKFNVYLVICNLMTYIILVIQCCQHLNFTNLVIASLSIIFLHALIFKYNKRISFCLIAITLICIELCYILKFFDGLSLVSELNNEYIQLKNTLFTAIDNFWLGSGSNTFSRANLETNPSIFIEFSSSELLSIIIEFGFLGGAIYLWQSFKLLKTSLNSLGNSKIIYSNLFLILPFLIITVYSKCYTSSLLSLVIFSYVIWIITCETPIQKIKITYKDLYIRRVPIILLTVLLISYFSTGLISIFKFKNLYENNNCENIVKNKLLNPFYISEKYNIFLYSCIFNAGMKLPSSQLINYYHEYMMENVIPYKPKRTFVKKLLKAKEYYNEDNRKNIEDLAGKLYPELVIVDDFK